MAYIGNSPAELVTELDNAVVTAEKLANDAVTAAKIVDGTIIADDLSTGIIVNSKVAANAAIAASKLAISGGSNITLQSDGTFDLDATVDVSTGYSIGGTAIVDSSRNATFAGLTIDGATQIDHLRLDDGYIRFQNATSQTPAGAAIYRPSGTSDINIMTGTVNRAKFANGGDISFYNLAGNAAKLIWDASEENIEIINSVAGESAPIRASNKDVTAGVAQNVGYDFGLSRNSGAFKTQAGRIEVGRSADWTNADNNIDAYMSFGTYNNNSLTTHMTIQPSGYTTINGDLQLDSTSANMWIKGGATGTNSFINWTFSSDSTVYNKIGIDYDTRASVGFHIDAGYPIRIDSSSSAGITFLSNATTHKFSGTNTQFNSTGIDVDFQIQGENQPNLFYVNAGHDRIGLKENDPDVLLHVGGIGDSMRVGRVTSSIEAGGGSNHNWFKICELEFRGTSTFSQVANHIKIIGAGGTSGEDCHMEFMLFKKQQGTTDRWTIKPNSRHGMNLAYKYNTSGGSTGGGLLELWIAAEGVNYQLFDLRVQDMNPNPANNAEQVKWLMTNTNSETQPSGSTLVKFALTGHQTRYTQSGFQNGEFVVNHAQDADIDFRVGSDSESHALFVDASENKVCFGTNGTPNVNSNSTNVYDVVVNNGISIGDAGYTHGFIGTGGTDGNVVIAANAYPANLSAERYVIIETGSAGGGGPNEVARFANGEGVIFNNDNSNVKDFQVKTASENHCFFVDAGHNKIGMGMSDPSTYGSRLSVEMNGGSNNAMISCINSATSGTRRQIDFFDGSSTARKGAIETNGTSTTYNTTSDRRLKTDIQPIEGATATLMAMAPVTHKWKAQPSAPAVYGFIAQDMQALVPEAVSGDPDSDEMMSMDYGRITPVLVAALQDAHKKIAALEERLADLGGRS